MPNVPLCTVRGCPEPKNPDFHVPICGHGLEGQHHHVVKRSQGGGKGRQVFICVKCHMTIDNEGGTLFIKEILGKETIWAVDIRGKELFSIGGSDEGTSASGSGISDVDSGAGEGDAGTDRNGHKASATQRRREVVQGEGKRGQGKAPGRDEGGLGADSAAAEGRDTKGESPSDPRYQGRSSAAAPPASGLSTAEEAEELRGEPILQGEEQARVATSEESEGTPDRLDAGPKGSSSSAALNHEQKLEKAEAIRYMQGSRQWLAGDTAIEWLQEMNESAWQYLDMFGYEHPTLSNIINICERIKPPLRNERLKWGCWQLLYSLKNIEDIEAWAERAFAEKMKVRQLNDLLIEAGLKPEKKVKMGKCPQCQFEAPRSEFSKGATSDQEERNTATA